MILITGATGLVGAHLALYITKQDPSSKIRLLYRSRSSKDRTLAFLLRNNINTDQIEWCKADITDIEALSEAFDSISEVYHCAALVNFNPKHRTLIHKVNIEGTANVVNLSLSKKIDKLCHLSSIATFDKQIGSITITENNHWNTEQVHNVYATSKYKAELEVWRGIQEGLNAVIVNPGIILGEGFYDSGSGAIFSTIYKGISFYTQGKTGYVYIADVTKACYQLMKSEQDSKRFILVEGNYTYQEIFTKIAKELKVKVPTIECKPWQLNLIWRLERMLEILTNRNPKLYKQTVKGAFEQSEYVSHNLKNTLPNFTFTAISKAILNCSNDFKIVT